MKDNELILVVRLTTNRYINGSQITEKRTLSLLKRRSRGCLSDLIQDCDTDLAELALHDYEDGIYQLSTRNEQYDIESGIVDDYDLYLIPLNK